MRILECSSKGDKRFSALYAEVEFNGRITSIERHYQGCKRFRQEIIGSNKGHKPDYLVLLGMIADVKYLTPFYKYLWVKYLDSNPELIKYAQQYDDFHDIFKSKNTINCQADVIREYVVQGRNHIMSDPLMKQFLVEILEEKL